MALNAKGGHRKRNTTFNAMAMGLGVLYGNRKGGKAGKLLQADLTKTLQGELRDGDGL